MAPDYIDENFIRENTEFPVLIDLLHRGFSKNDIVVPPRNHYEIKNSTSAKSNTLLLMPAWEVGQTTGVKLVTVNPENTQLHLPTIQGSYLLFDSSTGIIKAMLDAKRLTTKRTAATSALASKCLSNPNASSILMVGTGALAPDLIRAHCSIRPIEQVFVWGRNKEKAIKVCEEIREYGTNVEVVNDLDDAVPYADIISCATSSSLPLIKGTLLRPGQHIDLVGSYTAEARESDDVVVERARIFVDEIASALKEAGDIIDPIKRGVIQQSHICADLFDLGKSDKFERKSSSEITLFKSVGHGLEDLVAANYYFAQFKG